MEPERGDEPTQDTWHRIDEAFRAALDRPPEAREPWVRENFAEAPELRDAVLGLLADAPASERLFEAAEASRDALAGAVGEHESVDLVGRRIGPWRLEALIATGGMGAVYRAERDGASFRQIVAVKILPAWATDEQTVTRLRAERQILSRLQHPGITRLIDGGRTGDGFPYLVTEFIDGVSITDWVEEQGLALEDRLKLFLRVADAVQYAHEQGVLHRDIKPANVLVDHSGRPHLLDFGIATLLEDAKISVIVARTATGFIPMTPEYASPEQIAGDPVSVATDVYQLGLLLYRLLTGRRLLVNEVVRGGSVTRPSAAMIGSTGAEEGRSAEPAHMARALRGSLDTIILKALRSAPEERYDSVRALSRDLRHFLAGEAIEARPETLWAATRRLARHYPLAATLAVSLFAVLLFSVVSLSFYARELDKERQEAERQAHRAGQVRDVLIDAFRRTDPLQADAVGAKATTVWQSLGAAEAAARASLADDPEILAELLSTLAILQLYAGEEETYRTLVEESRALYAQLGPAHRGAYLAQTSTLGGELATTDPERSQRLFAEARTLVPAVAADDPHAAALALLDIGVAEFDLGNGAASLAAFDDALALLDRPGANNWSARIEANFGRGKALINLERLGEAAAALERALSLTLEHFGEDHGRLTGTLNALSGLARASGDGDAAIAWGEELVAVMARNNAPTYDGLLSARNNLALAYVRAGRHEEGQAELREVIAARRELAGPEGDRDLGGTLKNLASSLYLTGDLEAARAAVLEARSLMERYYPEVSPIPATAWFTLGQIELDSGRPAVARDALETALEILLPVIGPGHVQSHIVRCYLAETLRRQDDLDGARSLAEPAYKGILASEVRYPEYQERCRETVQRLSKPFDGSSAGE
ncbi:MAG: serine/threonine-protein kinase [Wenzhouxiangella sp.]|jgi:tetratricopeptide (TPR) repeat protein|nr:serine/threonine-protein kinase [Wenzhouxiangella sp.]